MNTRSIGSIFFALLRLVATSLLLGLLITQAREAFQADQRWAGFWVAAAFCLGMIHSVVGYLIREYRSHRNIEDTESKEGSRS